MIATRRHSASLGLLAVALLAALFAVATPVFAGGSAGHRDGAGASGTATLAITPNHSKKLPPVAGGPISATPLRHGSGRTSRTGTTASLSVVLALPGRAVAPHKAPFAAPHATPKATASPPASRVHGALHPATGKPVTEPQLRAFAASAKHPIFWDGPTTGTYELATAANTQTSIRYLPPNITADSPHRSLTIGTYIAASSPYLAARGAALAKHALIWSLSDGGLVIQYRATPRKVDLVFPRARYQVEVYDPAPGRALELATSGKIVPIPVPTMPAHATSGASGAPVHETMPGPLAPSLQR